MNASKDMGNKESIEQTTQQRNSQPEMNILRENDILKTSTRDAYKQNFLQNSPIKVQSTMINEKNIQKLPINEGAKTREELISNYTTQPMFNSPAYNNTVFSGQMIPPMLVQQPISSAIPGMFQTGFMYQTLPHGAMKTTNNTNTSHFFPPFTKGSLIMLATGNLKPIEELKTADFIESAKVSKMLCLETSTVAKIQDLPNNSTSIISFAVDDCDTEVMVEKPSDHPFFIYEQGWASCKPHETLSHYGLQCQKLKIGDICIFLSNQLEMRASTLSAGPEVRGDIHHSRTSQQNTVAQNNDLKTSDNQIGVINGEHCQTSSGEQDFGPSLVKKAKLENKN